MTPVEERSIDKSSWYRGPWDDEPDRVEWRCSPSGLACLIVRNADRGFLCGYVGVPPGHPDHGRDFYDVNVEVHGGLTYSDRCQDGGKICYVPRAGEPVDVWWLGFDCWHAGDYGRMVGPHSGLAGQLVADLFPPLEESGDVYRNIAYVRTEVEALARQLEERACP